MKKSEKEFIQRTVNFSIVPRGDGKVGCSFSQLVKALDSAGFVIVPKEPTEGMIARAFRSVPPICQSEDLMRGIYSAMLSSAQGDGE